MLRDFVLELVPGPASGPTITLPGAAPPGRVTWATGFANTSQPFVFYVLDDSIQQEWAVGVLTIGSPSTITRPTVVMGNSAGNTARLNFANTTRCYCSMPSSAMLSGMDGAIGRNHLINPRFDIAQRGAGPFTANGYTLDGWQHQSAHSNGSFSDSRVAISDADRAVIGDESAAFAYQSVVTGGTGAGDFDNIPQAIENVRRLAGKTVTLSFWAKAAAGAPKVGIEATQVFGTGGSPSANVTGINSSTVTLGTAWARYSVTFAMPSISGKTLGTNGNDYSQIILWLSAGTTFAARSGTVGVQTATFSLWGMELTIGRSPFTAVERRHPQIELALCQRYFQIGQVSFSAVATGAVQTMGYGQPFVTEMRAAPTISYSGTSRPNLSSLLASSITPQSFFPNGPSSASGPCGFSSSFTATAEL